MQIVGRSEMGDREYNEDRIFFSQEKEDEIFAIVADGLGGCGGGEIAAKIVTDEFEQSRPQNSEEMREFFLSANNKIRKRQDSSVKMKSTAVAIHIMDNRIVYGHIGDSRLYHFYQGILVSQTLDHSVTQLAVLSGEIQEEDMRCHVDRNKLLRALGASDQAKPVIQQEELELGNHAFLLCSDGFWEYVTEKEMIRKLQRTKDVKKWLSNLYKIWKKKSKNADNSSAVAIFYHVGKRGE